MSQENVGIMRELYEAFNQGDIQAVLGQMHESIEWTEADGDSYTGPQAVLEGFFVNLGNNWDEFRITPEEFLDAGEHVVALGSYTGSNKATGVSIDLPFAHVWKLEDGRLMQFREFSATKPPTDAAE